MRYALNWAITMSEIWERRCVLGRATGCHELFFTAQIDMFISCELQPLFFSPFWHKNEICVGKELRFLTYNSLPSNKRLHSKERIYSQRKLMLPFKTSIKFRVRKKVNTLGIICFKADCSFHSAYGHDGSGTGHFSTPCDINQNVC